jgi:hypothetical protein
MVFSIPTSSVGFDRTLLRMLGASFRMSSEPDGKRASRLAWSLSISLSSSLQSIMN